MPRCARCTAQQRGAAWCRRQGHQGQVSSPQPERPRSRRGAVSETRSLFVAGPSGAARRGEDGVLFETQGFVRHYRRQSQGSGSGVEAMEETRRAKATRDPDEDDDGAAASATPLSTRKRGRGERLRVEVAESGGAAALATCRLGMTGGLIVQRRGEAPQTYSGGQMLELVGRLLATQTGDTSLLATLLEESREEGDLLREQVAVHAAAPDSVSELLVRAGAAESSLPAVAFRAANFSKLPSDPTSSRGRDARCLLRAAISQTLGTMLGREPGEDEVCDAVNIAQDPRARRTAVCEAAVEQSAEFPTALVEQTRELLEDCPYQERVRLISQFALDVRRLDLEQLLEFAINPKLFAAARRHALFTGAGVHAEAEPAHRVVLKQEELERFVKSLLSRVARSSFGESIFALTDGEVETLPRLMRTGNFASIFHHYVDTTVGHFGTPPDEERCLHKGTGGLRDIRCFHTRGHSGGHSFHPKGGVSLSKYRTEGV